MEKLKFKKWVDLLGLPAKDKITGFSGTLTSISFDLYGCIQIVITPNAKDGKILDDHWFDSGRIQLTGDTKEIKTPSFDIANVLKYDKGPTEKPLP